MNFTIIARDSKDKETLSKRLAARDTHLALIHEMKAAGNIIDGGALLDDDGAMTGSIILCDFEDRTSLDGYLSKEIYATCGVWDNIEVLEMRRVQWR